jgi:GntR family transcriptional repressor for pyruvate dehydrogenase complex
MVGGQDIGARIVDGPTAESFPEIKLPRASDAVTQALVDGIRAGVAPIGSRLPRDHELALRFGVSRAVVREALDRLRRAGLLEIRRGHGGGAMVRSLAIPTELLTEATELGDEEIGRLLEARRTIETASAALATERANEADLKDLQELVSELGTAHPDPQAFIELDVRFHLRIAAASGNPHLEGFLSNIFRDLAAARSRYPMEYGSMEAARRLQQDTLDALRSRNRIRVDTSIDAHLHALEEHFTGND